MSDAFIHTCYVEGEWPKRDDSFTLWALVGESLAVYYWCEWFFNNKYVPKKKFCVVGQRGLSEYAARITPKVLQLIQAKTERLNETVGYQFGLAVGLREALRHRRDKEMHQPEYADQCNVSTYRAQKQLHHTYKVGVKDQPVEYDLEGFKRGRAQEWTLSQFKTPIQVLDEYGRKL